MRLFSKIIAVAVAAVAFLPVLSARGDESLESVEYWKGQVNYIKSNLDSTNSACGTTMTFDWVNKEDLRKNATAHNNSPNGICGAVVDEVGSVCRSGDEAKKRVQAKIKSIKCGYANPRDLTLSGGTLTYKGNNEQSNFSDWANPKLKGML